MTKTTVYCVPGSPYVRSALLGLEEKDAAYTLARMPFGSTKQPSHLERHPFGRVPVLEHDGFMLYETQAILRFVDAVFPGEPLQPTDPYLAARMNQLIGIVDWYFRAQVSATISFNRLVAPRFGIAVDESVISRALPDAERCLREIDRLKGDAAFLVGPQITIADLMLAPHMAVLAETPEGKAMLPSYPRLSAWLAHVAERPSMMKTTWERLEAA